MDIPRLIPKPETEWWIESFGKMIAPGILYAVLIIFLTASAAHAQIPKLRNESKIVAGWAGFADEGWIHHGVIGGSYRRYLTRNTSVEGEFLYMRGPGADRDFTLIPSIARDFGHNPKVRPYLIAGAGLLHHWEKFGTRSFSSNEWTGSGGGGVKIFLNDRLFVAPEARFGWEPLLRFTGSVGWTF